MSVYIWSNDKCYTSRVESERGGEAWRIEMSGSA